MRTFITLLLIAVESSLCFIDPMTAVGMAGLAALGYNFETVKQMTYCKINECCIDEYIPADVYDLERNLKNNLFGQHIVIKQLIPALRGHIYNNQKSVNKPLVISFHGTPGTGKNYVSDFIAKALYKNGLQSQYVYRFLGRIDFPLESKAREYGYDLAEKVRNAVIKCPRSLFIFDEVDRMPQGVFEILKSLLDHNPIIGNIDFRKAIFIFLSNTAGIEIAKQLSGLMNQGTWREDTELKDFEKILEKAAYNLQGGLQRASIIESHLIDHFIPFLPLEKEHIKQCIIREYRYYDAYSTPSEEDVNKIIDDYVTFDDHSGLFAITGCKRLSKKVEVAVHMKNEPHW